MKLRTVIKIAITTSVALLCTGFVVFSFFRLSAAKNQKEFELYSLVPPTATAVFETDDMAGLVQEIGELDCSKEGHFLYISKLFSYLKLHFNALLEETPHGLSRQMNKMLFSFHEPDNDRNQILYCTLGFGDYVLVENFIKKYCSSSFPSKLFEYKGEEIRIYPLPDNDFLACYFTSDFLVVSYQKKLIEQVIDARLSGKSLLKDPFFSNVHAVKKSNAAATIYTRMQSLDMGKLTDGIRSHASLGGWTEFDMKLDRDVVYFTGISHDTDTCMTFMNMLRKQQPVEGFPGDMLPLSTFFFSRRSVSDLEAMLDFTSSQEYARATYSNYIKERDEAFIEYVKENGRHDIMTCLFLRNDTADCPAAIASLPVWDAIQSEHQLKSLIDSAPDEKDAPPVPAVAFCYTPSRAYMLYVLPRNTLFAQLTGITQSSLYTYACIYKDHLLLSSDAESLTLYIHHLEKKETIEEDVDYKASVFGLSDMYNFMLVADLGKVLSQPENYVRLIPGYFFRNPDFFRYFTLSTQFTCLDGVIYPNIVLQYKPLEDEK